MSAKPVNKAFQFKAKENVRKNRAIIMARPIITAINLKQWRAVINAIVTMGKSPVPRHVIVLKGVRSINTVIPL
jgi:hypothetical protein